MLDDSSEIRTDTREARVLQTASLIGAVADAGALLPMLLPSLAARLWGLDDVSGSLLLVWASRRPLERRVVAPLTILVVGGLYRDRSGWGCSQCAGRVALDSDVVPPGDSVHPLRVGLPHRTPNAARA